MSSEQTTCNKQEAYLLPNIDPDTSQIKPKKHSLDAAKSLSAKKAPRSHFQYKKWLWDAAGKRTGAIKIQPLPGEHADLINTCYFNPSTNTETLYCIALDLDAHRAGKQWKTRDGRMKWPLVRKWLSEKHPQIFQYLFAAVKSTSGKGLAIFFVVQPLELVAKTRKAQTAVSALLQKLLCLFNVDQLGADPSAIGLKRDFCNWKNPEKLLYSNVFALRAIQSHRTPVVKDLLSYLKPFGFAEYVKKSQREGLLYPDLRAERKLAKLYLHLYNAWIDSKDHCDLSVREIREMTGLSRPFVEKLLKAPPKWLRTQYISREEGWSLRIES